MPKFETMEELLARAGSEIKPLSAGDVVTAKVISINRSNCWVEIEGYGTGVIYGKELSDSLVSDIEPGDQISALVLETENDDGHVILSLKRASRERMWTRLEEIMRAGDSIDVKAFDANKGGLLIEHEGIRGFLPVSQLSLENYPRVAGGDKEEILSRLNSIIGRPLTVRVLDIDRRNNKLIFSEKAARKEQTAGLVSKFKVGQNVKGTVTGVVDFGIFMNIDGVEGLVHISELDWDRVEKTSDYAKLGDQLEVQIIAIDGDKVSLSLKRLKSDSWLTEVKQFAVGDVIPGTVSKITPFGAFVKVGKLEALVHVSEMAEEHIKSPEDVVELGGSYNFKVVSIEPETRKLSLSLKGVDQGAKAVKPEKPAKKSTAKADTKKAVVKKATAKKSAPAEVAESATDEKPETES